MAIRLEKASFNGAPFLWRSGSTEEGQKVAIHEYPNVSRRYAENVGELPPTFSMIGIIHGTGSEYKQRRDALRKALRENIDGILVHPLYGSVKCRAMPFSINEDSASLGECVFSMTFKAADSPTFPTTTGNKFTILNNAVDTALSAIKDNIGGVFSLATGAASVVRDANESVSNISSGMLEAVGTITQPLDEFQQELRTFQDNIGVLIVTPDLLAASVVGLITSFQSLGSTPKDQFTQNQGFFDYGADDEFSEFDTLPARQSNTNTKLLSLAMQAGFLAESYRQVGSINFDTENTLNGIRDALEAQYDKLADILDNEVLEGIEQCRSVAGEIFQQQEINIFRIVSARVNPAPMGVIAYRYYGNVDNEQTLIELNDITDSSRVSGEIEVFSN